MDALLGNYASDDDNEGQQQQIVVEPTKTSTINLTNKQPSNNKSNITSSNNGKSTQVSSNQVLPPGQKKRKLLDLSIFPEHIQKALIHGDAALGDSDDDDDRAKGNSSAKSGTASTSSANNSIQKLQAPAASIDPLLAMLPAPVNNKKGAMDAMFAPKLNQISNNSNSTGSSSGSNNYNKYLVDHHAEQNEEEDGGGLGGNIGFDRSDSQKQPPLLSRQFTSEPDSKYFSSESVGEDSSLHSSSTMYPSLGIGHNNGHYVDSGNNNDYNSFYNNHSSSTAPVESQRKRQRNMENMLANGDLSVLQQGAIVQDINVNREWDAFSYTEQKQKEAAIYKQYTADGTVKSVVQPTKQQGRKHQLTSLAMKAAETEIAMLESQIARGKTKSQTQSRYGW